MNLKNCLQLPAAALALLMVWGTPAYGQAVTPGPNPAALSGKTLDGDDFDIGTQRGKVVLVVFWSTDCAVCRDKMPELRANYAGWRGQPFEMVLVSLDQRLKDVQDYEQLIELIVPRKQRFPQLWSGQPGYKDSFGAHPMLPVTYIVGKDGLIKKSYTGRVPPEAWDDIADLL